MAAARPPAAVAQPAHAEELAQLQGLLEDSEARVSLLEGRLRDAMDAQQELLMRHARREVQAAQTLAAREPGPDAERLALLQREVAVAASLIANLESECERKEHKIGDLSGELTRLRNEVAALHNILRNLDPRALEVARRRMNGR